MISLITTWAARAYVSTPRHNSASTFLSIDSINTHPVTRPFAFVLRHGRFPNVSGMCRIRKCAASVCESLCFSGAPPCGFPGQSAPRPAEWRPPARQQQWSGKIQLTPSRVAGNRRSQQKASELRVTKTRVLPRSALQSPLPFSRPAPGR